MKDIDHKAGPVRENNQEPDEENTGRVLSVFDSDQHPDEPVVVTRPSRD